MRLLAIKSLFRPLRQKKFKKRFWYSAFWAEAHMAFCNLCQYAFIYVNIKQLKVSNNNMQICHNFFHCSISIRRKKFFIVSTYNGNQFGVPYWGFAYKFVHSRAFELPSPVKNPCEACNLRCALQAKSLTAKLNKLVRPKTTL